MHIYLPIAGLSVNVVLLAAIGWGIGILSGIFGVGGGFLLTPLLMFIGVPAPVAVASSANQLVGASVSGVLAYWRRGTVDVKMGLILLIGGLGGSVAGVWIFKILSRFGQLDLVISLCYVVLLGILGGLMLVESAWAMWSTHRSGIKQRKLHRHMWIHGLPFKMRFRGSNLYISALLPLGLGFAVGVLSAIMGVGGGFAMVPAMIYLIGMPTKMVPGTSLFQSIFVSANVTFLQAFQNQTVDIVLAMVLLLGGVLGAPFGARLGIKMRGEQMRGLLGLIVLTVAAKLTFDLVTPPDDLFTLIEMSAGSLQ